MGGGSGLARCYKLYTVGHKSRQLVRHSGVMAGVGGNDGWGGCI